MTNKECLNWAWWYILVTPARWKVKQDVASGPTEAAQGVPISRGQGGRTWPFFMIQKTWKNLRLKCNHIWLKTELLKTFYYAVMCEVLNSGEMAEQLRALFRGLSLISSTTPGGSRLSVTPTPEYIVPSSGLRGHPQTYGWYIHKHKHTSISKNKRDRHRGAHLWFQHSESKDRWIFMIYLDSLVYIACFRTAKVT